VCIDWHKRLASFFALRSETNCSILWLKLEIFFWLCESRKYSRVKLWTLALSGGGDCIAVIRAAGSISRQQGSGLAAAGEGIASDTFIEKIRLVRGWFLSLVVLSVSTVLLE
jgi:hypothetical protein